MRPGKPLMAGRLDGVPLVGLPGNPVSAMVCGRIFLVPAVERMLGLPGDAARPAARPGSAATSARTARAPTTCAPASSPTPRRLALHARSPRQDSSLLSVLAEANALLRPPAARSGPRGRRCG